MPEPAVAITSTAYHHCGNSGAELAEEGLFSPCRSSPVAALGDCFLPDQFIFGGREAMDSVFNLLKSQEFTQLANVTRIDVSKENSYFYPENFLGLHLNAQGIKYR